VLALIVSGCATAFIGDDPQARRDVAADWLDEAYAALDNGQVDTARSKLIDAVELSPEYAEARNALGVVFLIEGNYEQAVNQLEWATATDPETAAYHYHLALAHIAQESIGFATPALNRALELDPDFLPAQRALLDSYILLGRWERADRLYTRLAERGVDDPYFQFNRALIAFAQEDFDETLRRLRTSSKQLPDDPAPMIATGLLFELTGRTERAGAAYRRAAKRAPKAPYVHLALADYYEKIGRYRLAENHLVKALVLGRETIDQEETATAYNELANVKYQRGEYQTSKLYRARALKMLPALKENAIDIDAAAHFALGLRELRREKPDTAIQELTRAVKGDDTFMLAWVRLGEAYILKAELSPVEAREKFYDRAVKSARKAQELAPRFALGYHVEGRARLGQSDLLEGAFRDGALREALFAFEKAKNAENAPQDIPVYQADLLSELAAYASAASTYAEAQKVLPNRFDIAFLRASELIKAEQFRAARRALSDAYRVDPGREELGAAMSTVLYKLGDVDGATAALAWEPGQAPLPGLLDADAPPETATTN